MVAKTSELLPEPETPVKTVKRRFGRSTETFLRLFSRAPSTLIRSWSSAGCVLVMLCVSPVCWPVLAPARLLRAILPVRRPGGPERDLPARGDEVTVHLGCHRRGMTTNHDDQLGTVAEIMRQADIAVLTYVSLGGALVSTPMGTQDFED